MKPMNEIVEELNDLHAKHTDAMNGFRQVAEKTESNFLRGIFKNYENLHARMSNDVKDEIKNLGGEIDRSGSVKGDFHRVWIDVKSFFSGNDDEAILDEVIRGQENCLEECKDVMDEEGLPVSTRTLMRNQCEAIKQTLNKLKVEEEIRG